MSKKVNYTIEESESCLENMITQAISEFDKACDNIDSKNDVESKIQATNVAEAKNCRSLIPQTDCGKYFVWERRRIFDDFASCRKALPWETSRLDTPSPTQILGRMRGQEDWTVIPAASCSRHCRCRAAAPSCCYALPIWRGHWWTRRRTSSPLKSWSGRNQVRIFLQESAGSSCVWRQS